MPPLTYNLTFGGIPFIADVAHNAGIRMPSEAPVGQGSDPRLPLRKQQSLPDLLDEVDRLVPFNPYTEFSYPNGPGNKKTADLAWRGRLAGIPFPKIKIGQWFYPNGASRWSVFRGLATSSQAKAMLALTQGNSPATFVMQSSPLGAGSTQDGAYLLSSQMYMLPVKPLGETAGSLDGLYLITLVDERYYWQFDTLQLHPTKDTTWAQVVNSLALELGIAVNFGPAVASIYTSPEPDSQLWCNASAAVLMDCVAANLGATWVRGLDGNYNLFQPLFSRQLAYFNRGLVTNPKLIITSSGTIADGAFTIGPLGLSINWSVILSTSQVSWQPDRLAGGDIFQSGAPLLPAGDLIANANSVLPASVSVSFPKYVIGDDPVPHFVNPRYTNQRPSAWYEDSYGDTFSVNVPLLSGGIQFSGQLAVFVSGSKQLDGSGNPYLSSGLTGNPAFTPTVHETAKALYSGEAQISSSPLNASGLTSLSMQVAYDYFMRQVAVAFDEVYPGTFAWVPDGVHDILWTYSDKARLASCRVMRSNWDSSVKELQHTAAALSGATTCMRGVGGPSVAQTWRDSDKGPAGGQFSGYITTNLSQTMGAGDLRAFFTGVGNLPTQNRWRGKIDGEVIFFEGTSGGISGGAQVVYRGIDSTTPAQHANNAVVIELEPHTTYAPNLVTFEKGQFVFPQEWSSGGIQGVNVVPQTQSVYVFDGSGAVGGGLGLVYHSGRVNTYDPVNDIYLPQEYVWAVERHHRAVQSGSYYDGTLIGTSLPVGAPPGQVAPMYALDGYNLSFKDVNPETTHVSGVKQVTIDRSTQILKLFDDGNQIVRIAAQVDSNTVPPCCPITVIITGAGSGAPCTYTFEQVYWNGTNWVPVPGGVTGTGMDFGGNCNVPIGTITIIYQITPGVFFFNYCCTGTTGVGLGGGGGGGTGGGGGGGGGGSTTGCCPGITLPATLCGVLGGGVTGTVTLTLLPPPQSDPTWLGSVVVCGGQLTTFTLICGGNPSTPFWTLSVNGQTPGCLAVPNQVAASTSSCNPLELVFNLAGPPPAANSCCGGLNFTFTVMTCGGGGGGNIHFQQPGCCPNTNFPQVMYLTLSGTCPNAQGKVALTFNGANAWTGSEGGAVSWSLGCISDNPGTFALDYFCLGVFISQSTAITINCNTSTILGTFTVPQNDVCCGGDVINWSAGP